MTKSVSREDVKAGIETGSITVVDALANSYFAQQHLPGAVNLVADEVASRAATVLPDKGASIVTYCANPACPNSGQVATLLTQLGYTDVSKYAGGIEDWVEAGLPTESGLPATESAA